MDHEKYLFMRMLYNIFFNYIHIFYINNIWHVSSDQCEDKFSRLFLLTLSVKANRMSNLIVCVLGWSTDWGADRWVQGGILPLRQGWRRHHHHQGVGNCKFQQHSLNNFLQPISSSKGSPRQSGELSFAEIIVYEHELYPMQWNGWFWQKTIQEVQI